MNRTLRKAAWAASLCLSAAAANAFVITTNFDAGAEGWAAAGNGAGGVEWSASTGQAGGGLALSDAAGGWAYFAGPSAYRTAMLPGAALSFDMRHFTDAEHSATIPVRVALVGAGLTLVAESTQPTGDWSHYEFTLGTGGLFRVLPSAADEMNANAPAPTAQQWAEVLASLNSFYISADYSSAFGPLNGVETTWLDNVRLEADAVVAEVPEPGSLALLGGAMGALAFTRRRRAR